MKLYTRAALGVIAAFILTYAALGIHKAYVVDPGRRALLRDTSRPGLELAASRVRSAPDTERAVSELAATFDHKLRLERLERAEPRGWFVRGGEMFAYSAIDDSADLVYGPFPPLERPQWMLPALALGMPVVMAAIVAFIVVAPVIRRVRGLERVTRRVAEGDFKARAEVNGRDAVASLSVRFNQMADEIERLLESQKELLQAVSHEFRTPTSRIRFALEMLESADDARERDSHVKTIDESLVELDELVDELLTYVRFENRTPSLAIDTVDVGAVAASLIEDIEGLRPEIVLRVRGDDEICVRGNARYFRRALSNLVLNALHFANGEVTIEIEVDGETVTIAVVDDGPGIAEKDRERVFEPFARLEESRSRESGGAGLGLAIVRRVCSWHGATVTAEGGVSGARLVLRWPAA